MSEQELVESELASKQDSEPAIKKMLLILSKAT